MKAFDKYAIFFHLIGWCVYFSTPLLVLPSGFYGRAEFSNFVTSQLINNLMIVAVFYLNLLILSPKLLLKKRGGIFVFYLALGLIIVLGFNLIWGKFFIKMPPFEPNMSKMPSMPKPNPNFPPPPPPRMGFPFQQITGGMMSYLFAIIVSSLIVLWQDRIKSHDTQQKITLEKVAAELAVLKLQVSPHFLFNTLNNIRWLARQKSELTEDAIVKLSQLLRYMIYQSDSDTVPLQQEIDYLHNYIDLQKMRISAKNKVTFQYKGPIERHVIEPLLFIPMVENAFKYGLHGFEETAIAIRIEVLDNMLYFSTRNPIFENNQTDESGIGLKNVRKRLSLHYPDRYSLKITEEGNIFCVDLSIELK
jgi:hypothetical protein